MIIEYQKGSRVVFKDIRNRECFYSSGVLYKRILQQDLESFGIDCVNAISILNGGLTLFDADEEVYKAEVAVYKRGASVYTTLATALD